MAALLSPHHVFYSGGPAIDASKDKTDRHSCDVSREVRLAARAFVCDIVVDYEC